METLTHPRETSKAGRALAARLPTLVLVTWAPAVPRWTSGVRYTLLTLHLNIIYLLTDPILTCLLSLTEANKAATAYTPHPCVDNAYHSCSGDGCGGTFSDDRYGGTCDADGCDFNAYRQGNQQFYGEGSGFTIDSTQPITVVTQFHTGDDGLLSEIRRVYVQNGEVIANS